jgi:hypothetical protein
MFFLYTRGKSRAAAAAIKSRSCIRPEDSLSVGLVVVVVPNPIAQREGRVSSSRPLYM